MKRNSFRSVAALLAVVVMLALPGCDMGNNSDSGPADNPGNGLMTLSTAEKIFGIGGFQEDDKHVEILKFNDVEALGDYISGTARRARAGGGPVIPAEFNIGSINGKPVTRIAAGAFKPAKGDGSDDISTLAAFLNPDLDAADLPVPKIALPETLDLNIDELGGGLFEGVSGAIKVDIPTPVLERILEKEIEKRVEGLSDEAAETRRDELKQALKDEPNGALAKELVKELTERIQEAVGKGAGGGAAITIDQVAPAAANPNAPVKVPDLYIPPYTGNGYVLAGTVWNGKYERTVSVSCTIADSKFTWDYSQRYATELTLENGTFTSGQSLAGTKWSGMFGNIEGHNEYKVTFEFIDETNAKPSWGGLDRVTYTLNGNTINFNYTTVREGTLAFKENSAFQFNDRNTEARGTYKTEGDSITLNGEWLNGDAGAGTPIVVSGTISGRTIDNLTSGVFWGIRTFSKEEVPWYPK